MNIQPTYITFEQAKLLKDRGFDEYCSTAYDKNGKVLRFQGGQESMRNTETYHLVDKVATAPEQWMMIEWLLKLHKINIHLSLIGNGDEDTIIDENTEYSVTIYKDRVYNLVWGSCITEGISYFKSSQEAYSAAFDYILKELL